MLEFRTLVEYVKLVFTIYRWPSRFWCVTRAHTWPKSVLGCLLKWTVRYITKHPTLYYGGTCLALFLWTVVLYQYSLLAHGRQPLTAVWIQWPVVFGIQGTLWVPWTLIVFSGYGSKQGNSQFRIVKYGDSYKLWHYFLHYALLQPPNARLLWVVGFQWDEMFLHTVFAGKFVQWFWSHVRSAVHITFIGRLRSSPSTISTRLRWLRLFQGSWYSCCIVPDWM